MKKKSLALLLFISALALVLVFLIPTFKSQLSDVQQAQASAPTTVSAITAKPAAQKTPKPAKTPVKTPKPTKKPTPKPTDVKITISAAGDCTLGSDPKSPVSVNFYSVYNKVKDNSYFFKKVKRLFAKDDMTLVNFEGTLTKSSTPAIKTFTFKGNPSYVNILKKGSIEAVSFANNHCRDYGEISYSDTRKTLRKAGIRFASYSTVTTYKVKGKKIGMVAVNGLEGVSYSQQLISDGIKKLKKKKADIIIVSMHVGVEHTSVLNDSQKILAHYAVDKGADLVLGHHPHVLQGIEKYKGVNIVYSLGNFCFGGNTNPTDKDTMIFQQTFVFRNGKLKLSKSAGKVVPCSISSVSYINNYQPKILKGSKRTRILKKINSYSSPLGVRVNKKGIVTKKKK